MERHVQWSGDSVCALDVLYHSGRAFGEGSWRKEDIRSVHAFRPLAQLAMLMKS
jgi:hypothetical protein